MNISDSHEWLMYRAKQDLGIVDTVPERELELVELVASKKRRGKHWARQFQVKFARWVTSGSCPEVGAEVGYSRDVIRAHLARQFTKGMGWENHASNLFPSKDGWVIDHIIPKRMFLRSELRDAYALTNLRPLWMRENMVKAGIRLHLV